MVGDDCEEGEGLVQLAKPQSAAEATLLSNFPHEAVQACCEGSLKQLSCEASPSLFKSGKAAALFAGRVRWKLVRLKKSRVSQFIQNTVVPAWVGDHGFYTPDRKTPLGSHAIWMVGRFWKSGAPQIR